MKYIDNAAKYDDIDAKNFELTVTLSKQPVFYDVPTIDSVLAYVVVQNATQGMGLPETLDPYYIPLPLTKMWTCPVTFAPLWNSTKFFPLELNVQQTVHWHKRGYSPQLLKKRKDGKHHNADFGKGPHKEYRIPLPQQSCLRWCAYGCGDVEEIIKLLSCVTHLGKKRSQGHGLVREWEIRQISEFDYWKDGKLIKTFPIAYPDIPHIPDHIVFSRYETGWTPPYWLASLYQECLL